MYAKVAIDLKNDLSDTTYTYSIPFEYEQLELVGLRVLVEFGYQKLLGYIVAVTDKNDFQGVVKPILDVVDLKKEINQEQIDLAFYLSNNTMSTLAQSLQVMVPPFLRSKSRKYLMINDFLNIDANLAMVIGNSKKVLMTKELMKYYQLIKKEIDKGNIEITYDTYQYGKMKKVKEYYINSNYDLSQLHSQKRKDIVDYLTNNPYSPSNKIIEDINISDIILKNMEKDGVICSRITDKNRGYDLHPCNLAPYRMKLVQEQLLEKYYETKNKPYLLYTNDEQFKYAFLVEAIKEQLKKGKKVFICSPIILGYVNALKYLKPYLSEYRFLSFSGRQSNSEFYENYVTLKDGNYDIVVTSKVGLFLPLQDVGLFVMLDEDNYNYISEQTPKYDAHKVLEFRSNYHKAKMIYCSSTPSMEIYHQTVMGKIVPLKYFVDVNSTIKLSNVRNQVLDGGLTTESIESIKRVVANHQKVLLILDHKGYSSNVVCRRCGKPIKCPKCRIPLTYYQEKKILKCNQCDHKVEHYNVCPQCGSTDMMYLGVGLEQVRQKVAMMFPNCNVVQVDSETLSNNKTFEEILMSIEDDTYDIIVGTSILSSLVSKDNIGLIIVLNCDGILNFSDYRASEECFKLVNKAVNFKNCQVILQGLNLDHYAINYAINNDYHDFYSKEIETRKLTKNAPFYEVSRIIITGDYKDMYYYGNYFKKVFRSLMAENCEIIGPSYMYRYRGIQLILKYNDYNVVKKIILEVNKKFEKSKILVNYERYPRTFN